MNLAEFIETKHQPEILSFFLLAPSRAFYIKELCARFEMNEVTLMPILQEMVKIGGLKTFMSKGKRYYILKQDYKPFPELRSALIKDKLRYEDELFIYLEKLPGVKAVFLSGLLVGLPDLPVDILFVGSIHESALKTFLTNSEKMLGQEIDYSIMTPEEFRVRRDTFDRFVKDIFDYRHLVVFDHLQKNKK